MSETAKVKVEVEEIAINEENPVMSISLVLKDGTTINKAMGLAMTLTENNENVEMTIVGIPNEHHLSWIQSLKLALDNIETQILKSSK